MIEASLAAPPPDLLPALGSRTHMIGILDVTPDFLSDWGRFFYSKRALAHALEMERADIVRVRHVRAHVEAGRVADAIRGRR